MNIKIDKTAQKAINRFRNLSEYDVEDAAYRFIDKAEEFCENAMGSVCFEHYDEETDVTLFCKSDDGKELVVQDVRRGNLAGVF